MNDLDTKIRQALQAATDLPGGIQEPSLTEEIMATFKGRHSFLNISGAIKMITAGLIFYFCVYQFFQQETMMAMIAYGTATLICMGVACTTMLWLWVQMNHNTTVREIKKLELQISLLTQELQQRNQ
ncbi:MAG: uncharacterized membrane protein YciS (DUF1049 family) [Limisphaerales bacterium]|jgi:uncharacterized membrane protein YciS (DUF1049 family)